MSKFLTGVISVSSFVMLLSYQNCGMQQVPVAQALNSNPTGSAQTLNIVGTVEKSSLDGCNILVHSVNASTGENQYYNPMGVVGSPVFAVGNQVSVNAIVRTDLVSDCMQGQIIQVTNALVVNPSSSGSSGQ